MDWLIVCALIVIGLVLLLLEMLVISGSFVAGLLGVVSMIAGVYLGYVFYGVPAGHWILVVVAGLSVLAIVYILRASTWKKLGLNAELKDSVEGVDSSLKEGDIAVAAGRLAPMGNVRIGNELVEAESISGYVEPNQEVIVVKVLKNKIIVKLKSE